MGPSLITQDLAFPVEQPQQGQTTGCDPRLKVASKLRSETYVNTQELLCDLRSSLPLSGLQYNHLKNEIPMDKKPIFLIHGSRSLSKKNSSQVV